MVNWSASGFTVEAITAAVGVFMTSVGTYVAFIAALILAFGILRKVIRFFLLFRSAGRVSHTWDFRQGGTTSLLQRALGRDAKGYARAPRYEVRWSPGRGAGPVVSLDRVIRGPRDMTAEDVKFAKDWERYRPQRERREKLAAVRKDQKVLEAYIRRDMEQAGIISRRGARKAGKRGRSSS